MFTIFRLYQRHKGTAPLKVFDRRTMSGWCFIPLHIEDIAAEIQTIVRDEWLWNCPGRQSGRGACTGSASLSASLRVSDIFLSKVERITNEDVYCVGLAFASPMVRAIRDAWLEPVAVVERARHDPYPGEGHVSLVYFRGFSGCVSRI
ncbi:hypothetical protein CYMTET_45576 [Cymbomonas tetramitiformis]|uniref:Uncharacterized protein n=1 Tax=Cymbomonas tetramitiformis TaxID=36881 RepID=A0AAE0C001_9CHLO|nr:hypothetical protein CYMTET_45576 [Cymbomonas tetramitiformis]